MTDEAINDSADAGTSDAPDPEAFAPAGEEPVLALARTLKESAVELSRRCDGARARDGQGFNAFDTDFGHALAARPLREWDRSTITAAYDMLEKYRNQLQDYDINLEAAPSLEEVDLSDWTPDDRDKGPGDGGGPGDGAPVPGDDAPGGDVAGGIASSEGDTGDGQLGLSFDRADEAEKQEPIIQWPEDGEEASLDPQGEKQKVWIKFEYDEVLKEELKRQLTERWWDGERWVARLHSRNAYALLEIAREWDFEIEGDVETCLEDLAEGIWSVRQARWRPLEKTTFDDSDGGAQSDMPAIDGAASLLFPPEDQLIGKVKALPRRTFVDESDDGPRWEVPLTAETIPELLRLFAEESFQASGTLRTAMTRVAERADRRFRLSGATSLAAASEDHDGGPLPVEADLGYDLYRYQRASVRYAQEVKRIIIGDQMGLGKTISALATVHSREAYPVLVVCPATVKTNWIREAYQCLPVKDQEIDLSLLDGMDPDATGTAEVRTCDPDTGETRRVEIPIGNHGADVITTNYDILGPHMEKLEAAGIETLVVDESHKIKNPDAKRSERCARLAEGTEYRLLLTGTPTRNRPKEWFNQLRLIGEAGRKAAPLGTFFKWALRYCDAQKSRWGWDFSGASNTEQLNRVLRARCYVRREKTDVKEELPEVRAEQVEMGITNRTEYERADRDLLGYLRDRLTEDPEYFHHVADALGISEATPNDPAGVIERKINRSKRAHHLVKMSVLREIAARGKVDHVGQWAAEVLEGGETLLLFAVHVPVQDRLMKALGDYNPAHIFARDTTEERESQIERFQEEDECRVMVASLGAAKEGVDGLQHACSIVGFAEIPWSPADLDQATARLHRMGQTEMVNAYHLLAERTIDEDIYDLIQSKRSVVDATTDGSATGAFGEEVEMDDLIDDLFDE